MISGGIERNQLEEIGYNEAPNNHFWKFHWNST